MKIYNLPNIYVCNIHNIYYIHMYFMCIVYTDIYIQQKNMESFQMKLGLDA